MDAGSSQLIAESDEPGSVIAMVMTENHVRNACQVNTEFATVDHDCVGTPACVKEDAAAVDLRKSREAPFSNAPAVGEHSRENGDLQRFHAPRLLGTEW
jgi:hypothetical protein